MLLATYASYYDHKLDPQREGVEGEVVEDALRYALCALRKFSSAVKSLLFVVSDSLERENVPFFLIGTCPATILELTSTLSHHIISFQWH